MKLGEKPCRWLNTVMSKPPVTWLSPVPALGERGTQTEYAEWEFQNAAGSLQHFSPYLELSGRSILDVGCGVGGKSVYLALQGAREVVAIDIDDDRITEARSFAKSKSAQNIRFETGDSCSLDHPDNYFDLILFNDAFEHISDPSKTLEECYRILRPGGRIGLLFPPYNSPWGAHLFTHIRIPWAHLFFQDDVLVRFWQEQDSKKRLHSKDMPFTARRTNMINSATSVPDMMSLNQMTISRFESIVSSVPLTVVSYSLHVPGKLLNFLGRIPFIREYVVTRIVAILER
jgi:SAM-dependent methyltransferase